VPASLYAYAIGLEIVTKRPEDTHRSIEALSGPVKE
jgi:hypothetical protein